MIPASLLAAALAATAATPTPAGGSPARAYLKPVAASAAGCAATPEGDLVVVGLFAPEGEACPIAKVGDETVFLRELSAALELKHLARAPGTRAPAKRPEMDYAPELDRIITARLLVQEAREMQLDQTPEFRAEMESYRASRLRVFLQREATRDVKPDPAEVERLYRDLVREWKIASVLLDQEQDAKAFVAALKGGGRFEALAKKVSDQKKGRGDGKAQWVSRKHMLPEIRDAAMAGKTGVPVGPVRIANGWVVLRIETVRYPKGDADAMADARERSGARLEREAIRRFYLALKKRDAVVDEPLLKSLDFEAGGEKGFEALVADARPIATIKDEKPVTVGDLARELSKNFFHGMAGPIREKRLTVQKEAAFEKVLGSRLFAKEAAARKLATRPDYLRDVEGYERAYAFNAFIDRVITPDVKVAEADGLAFYEQHKAEFTAPEMFKLDGFAFAKAADAEAALAKLKAGTEFGWLRSTAPDQVPPEKRTLQFDGHTVSAGTFSPELARALVGAKAGEYRLYGAGPAEVYVLRVVEQIPPATQPYGEVRERIVKKLYAEKLDRAIVEYAAKLRKAQRVDVLIARVST
jgi:parvulin-like peptidyl-prolyl isomerase